MLHMDGLSAGRCVCRSCHTSRSCRRCGAPLKGWRSSTIAEGSVSELIKDDLARVVHMSARVMTGYT